MIISWTYFLLGIAAIGLVSSLVWFLTIFFAEAKKHKDNPWLINFNTMIDGEGVAIMTETKKEIGAGGRFIITGLPKTIDIVELEKQGKKLEEIQIITNEQTNNHG